MISTDFCYKYAPLSTNRSPRPPKTLPRRLFYDLPTAASSLPPTSTRLHSKSLPPPKSLPTKYAMSKPEEEERQQRQHKDLLVDGFHRNQELRKLLAELSRKNSDALRLLDNQGDWDTDQFWFVAKFLKEDGRVEEVLQVFDAWTDRERSRINVGNYAKIVHLLCEEGLVEEAVSAVAGMEGHGLAPSIVIYNSIVNGFAMKEEFDNAKSSIRRMGEISLTPVPETYNELLRAYGDRGMYDEMSKCVKKMGSEGCCPNEVTYNLLIVEFARGRLLEKMEGVCRTVMSKRMKLLPSTLVAMLEAYADLGILEKMERIYRRIVNSKGFLKENLVRKVAVVYIDNYRFVRLEEFGNEIGSITGRTCLVWCLLLLASACLLSKKGMESIVREMENANVGPNITFTNVLALAYAKMKDFRNLDMLLCRVGERKIKPDMVTVGVLFDACNVGYDGSRALDIWRKCGFLDEVAEMSTDPLVLDAFGKGRFLQSCEELYSALGAKAKEKKVWTYSDLLRLVFGSRGRGRMAKQESVQGESGLKYII